MMGIVNGIMTAVLLVLFVGIWIWAWSKRNKATFDEMANLPLQDLENDVNGQAREGVKHD